MCDCKRLELTKIEPKLQTEANLTAFGGRKRRHRNISDRLTYQTIKIVTEVDAETGANLMYALMLREKFNKS